MLGLPVSKMLSQSPIDSSTICSLRYEKSDLSSDRMEIANCVPASAKKAAESAGGQDAGVVLDDGTV